jgi:hypothetical protein
MRKDQTAKLVESFVKHLKAKPIEEATASDRLYIEGSDHHWILSSIRGEKGRRILWTHPKG